MEAEAFCAELHDTVGAEGVSDFELADCRQPQGRVDLQLRRRDEDGLVTRVHAAGETMQVTR